MVVFSGRFGALLVFLELGLKLVKHRTSSVTIEGTRDGFIRVGCCSFQKWFVVSADTLYLTARQWNNAVTSTRCLLCPNSNGEHYSHRQGLLSKLIASYELTLRHCELNLKFVMNLLLIYCAIALKASSVRTNIQ